MVAFPLIATIISLVCAGVATRRYIAHHRLYELSWGIAFGFFALGAGAATIGYLAGWTPLLVRLFYASGAILTTAFLGLGSLYLLLGRRLDRWGPGIMLGITALTFASVFNTAVDSARLGEAWYALQTAGTPTRILAILSNIFGATIVVGGALYSVSVGLRRGMPRERAFGVLLIAVGTLVVASGSSLIRLFGSTAFLFVAMAPGVAIIMAGYLLANRRPRPRAPAPAAGPLVAVAPSVPSGAELAPLSRNGHDAAASVADPALAAANVAVAVPPARPPEPTRIGGARAPDSARIDRERAPSIAVAPTRLLGPDDAIAVRALLGSAVWPSSLALGVRYLHDSALTAELGRADTRWLGLLGASELQAVARVIPGSEPATRHTAHLDLLVASSEELYAALLAAVLDWADGQLGLARLSAWAWPDDLAALAALECCGFTREGVLRAALFAAGEHRAVVALSRVPGELAVS